MSLELRKDFTTADPETLRGELRRAWAALVQSIRALGTPLPHWSVVAVGDGSTVRAQPMTTYAGVTFTIYTPGKPAAGDLFRIVTTASGSVSILSDDGSLIHGSASDSIGGGAHGWFEWEWVDAPASVRGWWRGG